jgi:hypothetical protein
LFMFPCPCPCCHVLVHVSMSLSMFLCPRPCFHGLVHAHVLVLFRRNSDFRGISHIHFRGHPVETQNGINRNQQLPFVSCKGKTETAKTSVCGLSTETENDSLFSLVGKRLNDYRRLQF